TVEFRGRVAEGESIDDLLPEAFAAVKEACRRLVGRSWPVVGVETRWDMVPYDVQLLGGVVLHQGKIAEMATGEGKTLVATMPLYLNALAGRGAHLVTVNDYLARRDAEWMGEIYKFLGLTVGCIQNAMDYDQRRDAYGCDITYGTNNEFGFDYLRDNMAVRPEHRVQRGFHFAIVDEVDSVLVDEARTPLIISGQVDHARPVDYAPLKAAVERLIRRQRDAVGELVAEAEKLRQEPGKEFDACVAFLRAQRAFPKHKRLTKLLSDEPALKGLIHRTELEFLRDKRMHDIDEDLFFAIDEKANNVDLLDKGREFLSPEDHSRFVLPDISVDLAALDAREDLSAEEIFAQKDAMYRKYAETNEHIHNVLQLLKAYSLFERDVEYVVQDDKVMIVDEFTGRLMPGRRYSDGLHQAIEAKEGVKVEPETQTLATITLQNFFRMYAKLAGMTGTAETEAREFYEIYKLDVAVIPTHRPIARHDMDDIIFRTKREKYAAIAEEIAELNQKGQPVLVGTVSVEVSELLSSILKRRGVPHTVLNAKYHQQEAGIVSMAGQKGAVTIATNMAGRGTDIKLGQGVTDLGGLHILGTERHESRRIDRQLRGRAGRQGDPGSSRFSMSLEDDLMRLFATERVAGIMDRLGVQEGEVIEHPLVTRAIGNAQKRVEAHNFEIRKHLLKYDDVMNKQREVIYGLRNKMLDHGDPREEVEGWIEELIAGRVGHFLPDRNHPDVWNLKSLIDEVGFLLRQPVDAAAIGGEDGSFEEIENAACEFVLNEFKDRVEKLGGEPFLEVVRNVILWTIDDKWRDHLYELDQLKHGIGMRAYGQKDPLLEYKGEAFKMFEQLVSEVEEESVRRIFRIEPAQQAPPPVTTTTLHMVATKAEAGNAFDAVAPTSGGIAVADGEEPQASRGRLSSPTPQPPPAAARRGPAMAPRAGRNDPCPCGSGKKYKKCHLPIDAGSA
ncbi:MAG: preprotein translocase subunit SecA, partial [Candidatus Eisenbacteria bacterium]